MSKHLVLGTDERDAKKQRDLWLKEHPGIKINRVHPPKRGPPPNLPTHFDSRKPLQVSILIEFALPEAAKYHNGGDITGQLNELHQLRVRVYKAELDLQKRAMSKRRPIARGVLGPRNRLVLRCR